VKQFAFNIWYLGLLLTGAFSIVSFAALVTEIVSVIHYEIFCHMHTIANCELHKLKCTFHLIW